MPSISVVIIAKNEERNIAEVLLALQDLAQEIILVDSGSTDRTKEIASGLGARVIDQDWLGYSAQKNFALSQAKCDWILSLDADEVITADLAAEINALRNSAELEQYDGFKIKRLLFIAEKAVNYGGFYPDAQLRLFRTGKGRFNDRLVHESVVLEGRIKDLKNHLLHRAYASTEQFQAALEKYAKLAAEESLRTGYSPAKLSSLNLILHPIWTFFYRYVIRAGFLDGKLGFELNLIYADYVRKKILYLRRMVKNSHN